MKVTTVKIKTNRHLDGFYELTMTRFGKGNWFSHCPSDLLTIFNKIEIIKTGDQHYIDGHYIEILSEEASK